MIRFPETRDQSTFVSFLTLIEEDLLAVGLGKSREQDEKVFPHKPICFQPSAALAVDKKHPPNISGNGIGIASRPTTPTIK